MESGVENPESPNEANAALTSDLRNSVGRWVPTAKKDTHRPGLPLRSGCSAGNDDCAIMPQTDAVWADRSMLLVSMLHQPAPPFRDPSAGHAAPGLGRLPRGCLSGPAWRSWRQRTTPTVFTVNSLADTVAVNFIHRSRRLRPSVAAFGRSMAADTSGGADTILLPAGQYKLTISDGRRSASDAIGR